ncbi:putative general secretion pathway protein M [Yersinia mollaretii]|uniref:type II secretion system protein GspM n=1 Tax=Yersinia mollaretii TaxID=33060 RepID=UPI0005DA90CE|nr:type II secretion system protein GspM [Yersinia mollaretii]CNK32816.1 putative general secretion pathway protein M [Yersinia mollaretii]
MMTKIKPRWQDASQREKWILSLGSLILLGLLLSQGVIAPLNHYQQQSEKNLRQAARGFAALMQQQDRISRLRVEQPPQFTLSADRAVHESARQQNIVIALQEANANRATLAPMTLPFPQLVSWLAQLESQYGLQASHLALSAETDNPGRVHISTLVLQRTEGGA